MVLWLDNIRPRYNYLKIWNLRVQKNLNIAKIAFKVQMKFIAYYNQKLSFYIFIVGNLQNIFMEISSLKIQFFFIVKIFHNKSVFDQMHPWHKRLQKLETFER